MLCDLCAKCAELLVARGKVRLAVDLNDRADLCAAREIRRHSALGSNTPRLLLRLCDALFTQIVDRLLHVAARLSERLLAIHHSCARTLAQFLYHCSTNCCHCMPPIALIAFIKKGQGITLPYPLFIPYSAAASSAAPP